MDTPVNISQFITLKTDVSLETKIAKHWYNLAKKLLPNGVISSIQTTDDSGNLRSVTLVHRENKDGNEYIIPLSRDLIDKEVEPLINEFSSENPDLDFDVEVSSAQAQLVTDKLNLKVDHSKYDELCLAWAKKQHETWLKDRTDSGWRYGVTVNLKDKTHPLLKPWHELPDEHKKVNKDDPQLLLDLLHDQGYSIIQKSELDRLKQRFKH